MFEVGKECKRRIIHAQHGGQTQGGMSTPSSHPIILLFTGDQGERYGYMDQFQPDGLFWYTGEGQVGDMQFVRANKALLEHEETRKRVFLFEETRKSFVRFTGEVECLGYGFDHGAGHPCLFLDDAKAPNCQKNNGFSDLGNYSEWPKVAGAVIQALDITEKNGQIGMATRG